MDSNEYWFWIIPGETYPIKRLKSTWRMNEEDARSRYGEAAKKVEDSLEVRTDQGYLSDMPHWVDRKRIGGQ
jgi:hypothetical protein